MSDGVGEMRMGKMLYATGYGRVLQEVLDGINVTEKFIIRVNESVCDRCALKGMGLESAMGRVMEVSAWTTGAATACGG